MKFSLYVILLMLSCASFGQGKTKCEILKKIFEYHDAWVLIKLRSTNLDTPIIFIDTAKFFEGCTIGKIGGRNVKISHDSSLIKQTNRTNIVVYVILKGKDSCELDFYSKFSHAVGVATLKKKRGKFFIIESHFGILD